MPDGPSSPQASAPDPVAAILADVQMQAEDHHLVPEHMVLPLLAALRAVREQLEVTGA